MKENIRIYMETFEINARLFYLFRRLLKRFDEVGFNVRFL